MAQVKQLKQNGENIYPVTLGSAVYMEDGSSLVAALETVECRVGLEDIIGDVPEEELPTNPPSGGGEDNPGDDTPSDPTANPVSLISGDLVLDTTDITYISSYNVANPELITGKRCLAKTMQNGTVAICYLDENNSELFHDGTTTASLDGSMGEVMVDLPEFYFKGETSGNTYTYTAKPTSFTGSKLSRRVLLGAFEGTLGSDNKFHSCITGSESTGNKTAIEFHQAANRKGTGWDIVDYDSHCKVAWMQYLKYNTLNSQGISNIGSGASPYTRVIGSTKALGNNDGYDSNNISIFGLENWWGDKYEWMSGIHTNGNGNVYVYDGFIESASECNSVPSGKEYRTITVPTSSGWISRVALDENADMIPIAYNGSSSAGFCDYGVVYSGAYVAFRSYISSGANGGAACLGLTYGPAYAYASYGSRLQYRGTIQIIDNPLEFINLVSY